MIIFDIAKKRFDIIKDIELCKEEYVSWSVLAKFYDKIEKDYFWGIPYNVLANKSVHPNRRGSPKHKITFEAACKRFVDKNKEDVELCEEEYVSWITKSKFYDKIEKDYFWSIPRDVLKNNSGHPKRRHKKRSKSNSFTFTQAKEKFKKQGRGADVELIESGYNGWSNKCTFYDKIIEEFWVAKPCSVYSQKSSHPRRHRKETVTFTMAKEKFLTQRKDVLLCEEEYEGWSKKGKFFDKNINEYFYAQPKSVYRLKSNHPKSKYEKAKKTSTKNHGIFHLLKLETKNKREDSLLKKYGAISPFVSKEVHDKIKKTNMKKYGVNYAFESIEIQKKIQDTCQKKYGVKHYGAFPKSIKIKKEYFTKYYIEGTKEPVKDWLKKQNEPKPAYTNLIQQLQKIDQFKYEEIKLSVLEKIINNFGEHKTTLEVLGEKLFNTNHYNKKPTQQLATAITEKIYRPDFKVSDDVYINVDGLYWHSEKRKESSYHFELRKDFEESAIRILQFREDEIKNKPNIVKSIAENAVGRCPQKIFARKCTIESITSKKAKTFLEENHLMGSTNAKHIGLLFENELVSVLSYKQTKHVCKIERFCSVIDTNVIGGFSKLTSHLEKNYLKSSSTEIHNWVDLRYGTGTHLLNKNYSLIKETLGWKWTDGLTTFNRLHCRANMDERKLTQQEYADEMCLYKIYDAGQRLYVKVL